MIPFFFKKEIDDEYIQENFKRLTQYLKDEALLRCNFKFLQIKISQPENRIKYPHQLDFIPKDIIIVHNLNNAVVTFHYADFDKSNLIFDVSASTELRLLVGRFE